jgi:rod shape-determining protein MreD
MSRQPSQPLHPWIWLGVPLALSMLATIVMATPIRLFGLAMPEPVFPAVLAYAWAVIRPSLLGPFALLLAGLFLDIFWGSPLGLWGLSLLLAYGLALAARSLMVGQSEWVLCLWYWALSAIAFGTAYLLSWLHSGVTPNLVGAILQFAPTAALYPAAHLLVDRFEDADVRFR